MINHHFYCSRFERCKSTSNRYTRIFDKTWWLTLYIYSRPLSELFFFFLVHINTYKKFFFFVYYRKSCPIALVVRWLITPRCPCILPVRQCSSVSTPVLGTSNISSSPVFHPFEWCISTCRHRLPRVSR